MIKLKDQINQSFGKEVFKNSKFSVRVGVLYKGKKVLSESFGKNYLRYDLASMTKAIFPSFTIINIYPELISKKISDILPWLNGSKLKVEDLLTHVSGLIAHDKLYLRINAKESQEFKKSFLKHYLRDEFHKLKPFKAKNKNTHIYSDIGFLLLGLVLEGYLNKPLSLIWEESKRKLKLPEGFKYNSAVKITAPSEECSWRKKRVQAEVLDRNAFVLGGVQPHAGLFGGMNDMLKFGELLRSSYKKNKKFYMRKNEAFATGFEVPSGKLSNAGSLFSRKSVGHLGFTGTSFWYDPEVDLFVCILANRTYPDRDDFSFNKYRPMIHDIIYKHLVK